MTIMVECEDCEGTGRVGRFGWLFGSFFGTKTCPTCGGVGRVPEGTEFRDPYDTDASNDSYPVNTGIAAFKPTIAASVVVSGAIAREKD